MKIKALYILLLVIVAAYYCKSYTGSIIFNRMAINVEKETRQVESFREIDAGGAFVIYLSQGPQQTVAVEADAEWLDKIRTTVKNGTLYLDLKDDKGVRNRNIKAMNVYITMPEVTHIDVSGATHIKPQTPIRSEGSVSFDLSGASQLSELTVTCKKCNLNLSGASHATVNLTCDEADVDVSGASNLRISGNVGILDMQGSGASSINSHNLTCEKGNMNTSGAARIKK